jgi:hypothetical protein
MPHPLISELEAVINVSTQEQAADILNQLKNLISKY